jgi:hypothetical protein
MELAISAKDGVLVNSFVSYSINSCALSLKSHSHPWAQEPIRKRAPLFYPHVSPTCLSREFWDLELSVAIFIHFYASVHCISRTDTTLTEYDRSSCLIPYKEIGPFLRLEAQVYGAECVMHPSMAVKRACLQSETYSTLCFPSSNSRVLKISKKPELCCLWSLVLRFLSMTSWAEYLHNSFFHNSSSLP